MTRNARTVGDKAVVRSAAVDSAAAHLVEDEDVGALDLLAHEIHHLPSAVDEIARAEVWPVLQLVPLLKLLQEGRAVDNGDHGVQLGALQELWLRDERVAEVVAHLQAPRKGGGRGDLSGHRPTLLPQSRARTSRGSATPDDSITMWSHGVPRSRESFISCSMPCRNSSAAVQQAQPFCSSTVSSAADAPPVFLDTSAASMLISATSFTRRPTLSPALFSSRCLSSVVFPAPRKPESSVMGVVAGSSAFSVESTIRVGFRRSTAIRRLTGSSTEHTPQPTGRSRGRPFWSSGSVCCSSVGKQSAQQRSRASSVLTCKHAQPILPASRLSTLSKRPRPRHTSDPRAISRECACARRRPPYRVAGRHHRAWLAFRRRATTTRVTHGPKPISRTLP